MHGGGDENATIWRPPLIVMAVQDEQASIVRFGVFEADLEAGELRKNGTKVKVQDLPFRALKLFLSCPNRVVSRDELRKALWPDDVFVDFDRAISSTINRLRETLDDAASSPRFVETVARSGYRWIAPVQVVATIGQRAAEVAGDAPPRRMAASGWPAQVSHLSRRPWIIGALLAMVIAVSSLARIGQHGSHSPAKPLPMAAAAVSTHVPSPEVEELYLRGRYYWAKRSPEELHQAVDYFSQAIVRDPKYAKAYVGLADTYLLLREFASMPEPEAYDRAFAAASKAAEYDDSLAEVHATLGFIFFWSRRNVTAANHEFERAISLDPNYANAHHWYGNVLINQGRNAEGLAHLTRAEELDPGSPSIRADKGLALVTSGHPEEGIAILRQLEQTDATFLSPHSYLADTYRARLECPDYLREASAEARLSGDPDKTGDRARRGEGLCLGRMCGNAAKSFRGTDETVFEATTSCLRAGENAGPAWQQSRSLEVPTAVTRAE